MKLHEIRQKKAAKVAEARKLLQLSETENRSLNDAERSAFDTLKAEIQALEADEARAQFAEDMERRAAGAPVVDRSFSALQGAVNVVEVMRSQMEGRSLSGASAEFHQETERRNGRRAQGVYVPLAAIETRAAMVTSGAGQIVPTDYRADQFIEPFRNNLLARSLGVRVLSGLGGNVSIPKFGTGNTTGWVAENAALPTGGMTFGSVTLAPKHAGGVTEMSRQLLQQSSPSVEQLVRDDLSFLLAQAIDSAIIMGGGTNEPDGVLSTAGIQTASLSTLSWPNIVAMVTKLGLVNVAAGKWLMDPKSQGRLLSMLDSTGLPANFLAGGKMADFAAYASLQVPEKAGTPNKGRVILGDWSQVLLGVWSEIDLLVNPYAETAYNKGNVLVRAMSTVDVAVRHPEAFVVADDVLTN